MMLKRFQEVAWGHEISHFLEEGEDTSHSAQGLETARARLQPPYSRLQAYGLAANVRNPETHISLLKGTVAVCMAGRLSSDFRLSIPSRRVGRIDVLGPHSTEQESLVFIYRDGQGPRKLSALAAYGLERYLRGHDRQWSINAQKVVEESLGTDAERFDSNLAYLLEHLDLPDDEE